MKQIRYKKYFKYYKLKFLFKDTRAVIWAYFSKLLIIFKKIHVTLTNTIVIK
jgi:hypothetical protein